MIALPEYIDADLWAEYVQQRKKDKKEMSPRSQLGRIKRLMELKAAGHDPNACIEEALNAHWLDFYVPRDKSIERAVTTAADDTRRMLDSHKLTEAEVVAAKEARARVMAQLRPAVRRVA